MIRVMFVCHGNICRSPMAEMILKEAVRQRGIAKEFLIASAATSAEEIIGGFGNSVYPPAREVLKRHGIPCEEHHAVQLKKSDYTDYDYIIAMERFNLQNMKKIIGIDPEHKVHLLLDYTDAPRDVADPWFTGKFDRTYDDIVRGCEGFLEYLKQGGRI